MNTCKPSDKKNELLVLNAVQNLVPEFDRIKFYPSPDPMAEYDFNGYARVAALDVKIRNNKSTQYPTDICSVEKTATAAKWNFIAHYILVYHLQDFVTSIYLVWPQNMVSKDIEYTHARTGELMRKRIYLLTERERIAKFQGQIIGIET